MHILGLLKINSILIKTLRDKGHIVDVFRNENKIAIKYPYNGTILYSNEIIDLSKYDAVLLLDISKTARYLYRLLSPHHLIIGNPFSRCKMLDKVTTSILLSNNGIDVVPSLYSSGVQNIENIKTLSNSIVEKHVDGSRGVDMFKYDNFDFSPKEGRIYQKYIDCGCKDER